ncbi:MAG TPA: relaxase/mobilization nuclease domain-containing protein, partial [Bacteroidia bacterium]|nr:relaxase/mobilization nuclease domain-containing protein [Bacteroidia bacterium]
HAANYLKDAKQMNFYQKLAGFERLNILNERATTKTLHVSLNFSSSEKLQDEKLLKIAELYMSKIGFGEQPFLVYKHEDAGHPHIHIVSTTIKVDGSRINTHNIGRNQSEKARKEIEQQFGLIKAERQAELRNPGIKPVDAAKVIYGKHETKRAISNTVGAVFNQYKFTSLPEFNAALKQFNVIADRGKEEGRIYKSRGLVYRILDSNGNKVGVPIKASSISCKPILDNLEKKFEANEIAREPLKHRTKSALDEALPISNKSIKNLVDNLSKQNIYVLLRQNAEGRLYGITFVDNITKCVFNGSDLGKGYSAAAIQSRLSETAANKVLEQEDNKTGSAAGGLQKVFNQQKEHEKSISASSKIETPLDVLLSTKEQYDNVPGNLMKKKRKRRKRNNNNF